MIVMDKIVKVQVWDTAGQERYRSITNAYYRGAEGILIVFDVTKKESFENIENWINEVTVYTGKDVIMICLGNKNDLKKGIDKKEIYEFQKKTGLEIINVKLSSLSNSFSIEFISLFFNSTFSIFSILLKPLPTR